MFGYSALNRFKIFLSHCTTHCCEDITTNKMTIFCVVNSSQTFCASKLLEQKSQTLMLVKIYASPAWCWSLFCRSKIVLWKKKTCQNLSKLVKTLRYPHRMMQQTGEDSAILKEGYLIKKVINATIVLKRWFLWNIQESLRYKTQLCSKDLICDVVWPEQGQKIKSWKKRWFTLKANTLVYHKGEHAYMALFDQYSVQMHASSCGNRACGAEGGALVTIPPLFFPLKDICVHPFDSTLQTIWSGKHSTQTY